MHRMRWEGSVQHPLWESFFFHSRHYPHSNKSQVNSVTLNTNWKHWRKWVAKTRETQHESKKLENASNNYIAVVLQNWLTALSHNLITAVEQLNYTQYQHTIWQQHHTTKWQCCHTIVSYNKVALLSRKCIIQLCGNVITQLHHTTKWLHEYKGNNYLLLIWPPKFFNMTIITGLPTQPVKLLHYTRCWPVVITSWPGTKASPL